jgi:hypothetical protein
VPQRYEVVTRNRLGSDRARPFVSEDELAPGSVLALSGRYWLVVRVEPDGAESNARAFAEPARYRIRLRHPDGREELAAFRRYGPDAPGIGHAFSTLEDAQPVSWEVVEERLAEDDAGEPYLDLVAERDYEEQDQPPDHELEHALANRNAELPDGAAATVARAEEAGLLVELVALEAGEAPDWDEARRYVDALVLEEIEDDLIELCGVDPDADPRDGWLGMVQERLRDDLESIRSDIEGGHAQIEEWDFGGGRIFAAVGSFEAESDPLSGHGWMCRLVDSGALTVAGFTRVRKAEI